MFRTLVAKIRSGWRVLRECLPAQVVDPNHPVRYTMFGRAKMMTGAYPLDDREPEYYMLYWMRLPSWQFEYNPVWDADEFSQAALAWHMKHGFRLLWIPVRNLP